MGFGRKIAFFGFLFSLLLNEIRSFNFTMFWMLRAPKEPEEPILRHLGRVPFSTLILDPKNRQKSSITRVLEPRKLSSRLHGSSIFAFSLVSCPNPKIIDFGSSFGSLLGTFWLLLGLLGLSWASGGSPLDSTRASFLKPFF